MAEYTKVTLEESEMPTQWYNIVPDLPEPPPPVLHPGTHQPVGPDDLAPLFPMALILQEVSQDRYIDIPGEVLDVYRLWRPSPLFRARRLEKLLDTPAKMADIILCTKVRATTVAVLYGTCIMVPGQSRLTT